MTEGSINILIGGEAGQGLVTIGEVLTRALIRSGYHVCVTQSYMSRIRGGHNTFAIRASMHDIDAPCESVDLLVALNAETLSLHKDEMSDRGVIVTDEAHDISDDDVIRVPFKDLASKRYYNTAALGIAGTVLGMDEELIAQVLDAQFGRKHPEAIEENRKVLRKSYEWREGAASPLPEFGKLKSAPVRLMLNGNQAIALGAISAGVKFASYYPMTPGTSIILGLVSHASELGLVVEQAEDEIAAINMALGASYAGVPSIVATSGGGFALMVEGVSLAGMIEIPIVIAIAQRPGPATGLPTRTEQGDLELALYAGHGEFPRAIYAPGNPEQCFHLTRKAVEVANKYQSPVFILTDQFLADSFRAVDQFDTGGLSSVHPADEIGGLQKPYKRFALTGDGISPRALPGMSRHLVVVDSDEHDEEGHITEDLAIRCQMVEKRLRKGEGIRSEVIPPDYDGEDESDLLLVCWGSSLGAVKETSQILRNSGLKAGVLHFPQVWPLVPEQFRDTLDAAGDIVIIEGNACGQFGKILRAETGIMIDKKILRYDGLPFTPEYVIRELQTYFPEIAEAGKE